MAKEVNLMELLENKAMDTKNSKKEGDVVMVKECKDTCIEQFIKESLVEGTDYGLIAGAKRPSLFKSGAEKICSYLRLNASTHITSRYEDYENGVFGYEAKITLVDENGVVRGEGCGSCNTKENRYIKSSGYNNANTVLKMAKKRGFIDAILSTAAISGYFTQDVEDIGIPDSEGNDAEASGRSYSRKASVKQINYLESLMKKNNTSVASMDAYIKKTYGVEGIDQISTDIASELIEKFKAVA